MEEKKRADRLRELLTNVRNEAEEVLFILGQTPEADENIIAAFDRILRVLNE